VPSSAGLHPGQFRRIAEGGIGDGGNSYPHAMAWFNGHLYVGTTRHVLVLLHKRAEDLQKWPVFPIRTAKGNPYNEFDFRSQVWRYHPPTNTWENVYRAEMSPIPDGKPIPDFQGVRNMMVWQRPGESKPCLCLLTWSPVKGPGPMIVRTHDGTNFEKIPLGKEVVQDFASFRPLVQLNGKIYTAPSSKVGMPNSAGLAVVYESDDPLSGKWRQVNETNFGDPRNESVFEMIAYNGHLYVATLNPGGLQLWKSDCLGSPPYRWTKVLDRGADRGPINETLGSLCEFNGALYVGSCIVNGGYDRKYSIGPAPVELLRVHPDDSWDLIMGEGRETEQGLKLPLSGLGPGFDKGFNTYLWRLCVHDGWLYAGTFAWSGLIPFIPREKWPADRLRMADVERTRLIMEKMGGFDLWRSRDGEFWVPVTRNGFGNYFNWGVRTMVSTDHGLFVGAANPFGPDVAVQRGDGWRYEPNPRGGCEVWLGGGKAPPSAELAREKTTALHVDSRSGIRDDERQEDFVDALISEFYEGAERRSCGLWRIGVKDIRRACRHLEDELRAKLPEHAAVTYSADVRPGASAEAVMDVEDLSRGKLHLNTLVAGLKPGGMLVASGFVSAHPRAPWKSAADLKQAWEAAGLSDVVVADATHDCWELFRQRLSLFIWEKAIDYEMDHSLVDQVRARLYGDVEPVTGYVIVSGKR
jgi:hypothetical protein